jgi:AcrR family transcriptional regulator
MDENGDAHNARNGDPTTTGRPRTQKERREKAERRMLQAAVGVLAEKGFAGLTLNQVGEAAGYSRGLPTHYFGRKDELLAAMARFIVERFIKGMQLSQIPGTGEGLAAVQSATDYYLESVARDPTTMRALLVILTEATSHPDLFPAIIELNRSSVERISRLIRIGQAKGEIRAEIDPDAQAVLILGQLRGVAGHWLSDPQTINIDQIRAAFRQSLERSLRP